MSETSPATNVVKAARKAASAMGPLIGLLVVMLMFFLIRPSAGLTGQQIQTILVQTMIVGIAAMGMTMIIISAGIDLSVGSAIALSSVAGALALKADWPIPAAVVAALGTGMLCGLYNGLLIVLLRLPPFIATLGTLGFFRGLAKWISESQPVSVYGDKIDWLNTLVLPTPPPHLSWMLVAPGVWIMIALAALMWFVLRSTVFGRHIFAIGSNEATARLCGVRVNRTKALIYAAAGLFVGLAGLLQFARLTQGDPTVAIGLELDVIAAVVIGGASLAGGQGSIVGTIIGALLMAYMRNRCVVLGWPNFVQEIIVGHIIIIAVAVDQWRVRRAALR